jgi:hypothetical protein
MAPPSGFLCTSMVLMNQDKRSLRFQVLLLEEKTHHILQG